MEDSINGDSREVFFCGVKENKVHVRILAVVWGGAVDSKDKEVLLQLIEKNDIKEFEWQKKQRSIRRVSNAIYVVYVSYDKLKHQGRQKITNFRKTEIYKFSTVRKKNIENIHWLILLRIER